MSFLMESDLTSEALNVKPRAFEFSLTDYHPPQIQSARKRYCDSLPLKGHIHNQIYKQYSKT